MGMEISRKERRQIRRKRRGDISLNGGRRKIRHKGEGRGDRRGGVEGEENQMGGEGKEIIREDGKVHRSDAGR